MVRAVRHPADQRTCRAAPGARHHRRAQGARVLPRPGFGGDTRRRHRYVAAAPRRRHRGGAGAAARAHAIVGHAGAGHAAPFRPGAAGGRRHWLHIGRARARSAHRGVPRLRRRGGAGARCGGGARAGSRARGRPVGRLRLGHGHRELRAVRRNGRGRFAADQRGLRAACTGVLPRAHADGCAHRRPGEFTAGGARGRRTRGRRVHLRGRFPRGHHLPGAVGHHRRRHRRAQRCHRALSAAGPHLCEVRRRDRAPRRPQPRPCARAAEGQATLHQQHPAEGGGRTLALRAGRPAAHLRGAGRARRRLGDVLEQGLRRCPGLERRAGQIRRPRRAVRPRQTRLQAGVEHHRAAHVADRRAAGLLHGPQRAAELQQQPEHHHADRQRHAGPAVLPPGQRDGDRRQATIRSPGS
jgi:hypothetical protein